MIKNGNNNHTYIKICITIIFINSNNYLKVHGEQVLCIHTTKCNKGIYFVTFHYKKIDQIKSYFKLKKKIHEAF